MKIIPVIRQAGDVYRVTACIDSGHKVLLFSQFTNMLADYNASSYGSENLLFFSTGFHLTDRRTLKSDCGSFKRMIRRFSVFLWKRSGTGLNLTAADIYIYDPWWDHGGGKSGQRSCASYRSRDIVNIYKLTRTVKKDFWLCGKKSVCGSSYRVRIFQCASVAAGSVESLYSIKKLFWRNKYL